VGKHDAQTGYLNKNVKKTQQSSGGVTIKLMVDA
jgi:hypothetical protein